MHPMNFVLSFMEWRDIKLKKLIKSLNNEVVNQLTQT